MLLNCIKLYVLIWVGIISLNFKQFNTIMNLDFSDDQKHLQDEARKFFDKEGRSSNARKVMDNPQDADQELWDKIVEPRVDRLLEFLKIMKA